MNATTTPSVAPFANADLLREPVAWLGTSGPGGQAALVPTWFAWDGEAFLVASKPGARKVRNVRDNPRVMLGIARVGVEMDAQLVEGCAEVLPRAAADAFRGIDLAKYDALLAADGLTWEAFFARYSAVIRIEPARFLPWQGPALAGATPAASRRGLGDRARQVLLALRALAWRPAGAPAA
jgi:PPOX class probable F420-dependent enzyme